MPAEPRSWLSRATAPDATLSPRRGSRSRARSEASAETAEDPPPKRRRRRRPCSPSIEPNDSTASTPKPFGPEPNESSSTTTTTTTTGAHNHSHSHPGDAATQCETCVNQERPGPPSQLTPVVEDPDLPEPPTMEACQPQIVEAGCVQSNDLPLPNPDDCPDLPDCSGITALQPSVGTSRPCSDIRFDQLPAIRLAGPGTSSGWWFFNFPPEIRNMIYEYSLAWPTSYELYAPYNQQIDDYYANKDDPNKKFPEYSGVLRTPTILLLCRRITAECHPVLQSKTFVIDRLPPWLPGAPRPMLFSWFIGRRTIQSLRHIELRIPAGQGRFGSGWVWAWIALDVLNILRERNSFDTLKVIITMFNDRRGGMWGPESEDLNKIIDAVRPTCR
jgi:hypothetical protein